MIADGAMIAFGKIGYGWIHPGNADARAAKGETQKGYVGQEGEDGYVFDRNEELFGQGGRFVGVLRADLLGERLLLRDILRAQEASLQDDLFKAGERFSLPTRGIRQAEPCAVHIRGKMVVQSVQRAA